ncbi:putative WD domain, G-beta repeat [Leishmania naiffi]|uniref:Cilia- and flagella-associated protein 52 n=2 Tax=Viannia TaxID=37616 RepID=A0AAW3A7K6_9TRYP
MTEHEDTPRLELEAALGFSGNLPGSLVAHPDQQHLLYALGACIVIRDANDTQRSEFFYGHNDKISCLTVSVSGRYVASGQVTHPGFQADVCIFDFEERRLIHRMLLHKVKVQALAFSPDEQYLVSVGGPDDNTVVLWDVKTGRPLCGAPAHHTETKAVAFFNNNSEKLITGGVGSLRVWTVDLELRKMNPVDINMGNMRRSVQTIAIEKTDKYVYCGTTSGDVICALLQQANIFKMQGPQKKLSGGILSTILTHTGDVLVGSGAGELQLLSKINLTVQNSTNVNGGVTGLALMGESFYVGTKTSNLYFVNGGNFMTRLRLTCHSEAVQDVVFPHGFSSVFATCCDTDIRVWNANSCTELLRIEVSNRTCNCLQFSRDGSLIISGWSDGRIRAFGPQSGKLVFSVADAHKVEQGTRSHKVGGKAGVTSVCADYTGRRIITGGSDGLVRVWAIHGTNCTLEASMKEHKTAVNDIVISHDDTECVTASDDGSCIVWDLTRYLRRNIMYRQTYFRGLEYYVDDSQLITCGSDKCIAYWDSVDCHAIREVPGSRTAELNSLSLSPDGRFFVTGGNDRIVKVWDYDRGECIAVGLAHSCSITKVRVSPDGKKIVSVGDEGAVMVWSVGELAIEGL